jgi:hypothetical protein
MAAFPLLTDPLLLAAVALLLAAPAVDGVPFGEQK